MGKQYNKVIKRRRRNAYLVRKAEGAADTKKAAKSKAKAPGKKSAPQPAASAPAAV